MLTSEELFPPEYCFAGGCSSHLARSSFSSPRVGTPSVPFMSFPTFLHPSFALPPAPFTRRHCFNETGNVQFVRPALGPWRESCTQPLHSRPTLFPSLSILSRVLAKSVLLVRNGTLSYARAYPRRITTVALSYGVLPRREIIFFFLFFFFF